MQVFGYSPTTKETNYSTFTNVAATLTGAGFADLGVVTNAVSARGYLGGDHVYGGVVSADGATITQPTPAPNANDLNILSVSIARGGPVSSWGITEIKAWAASHPGATIYVVFR